jgi:hypothetical protein
MNGEKSIFVASGRPKADGVSLARVFGVDLRGVACQAARRQGILCKASRHDCMDLQSTRPSAALVASIRLLLNFYKHALRFTFQTILGLSNLMY